MVSAELIHNPYLLETVARFNGREPKVNSAIEKFEGHPLVEWADEVPRTFCDELNGLDFDLSFVGTDADYKRVLKAFADQDIGVFDASSGIDRAPTSLSANGYDVRMSHAGSFEDVATKRNEIRSLLTWLDLHRNRWFDYDEFVGSNSETLDASVPYIIVNENPIQLDLPSVSVETVDSARQNLVGTVLTDTPILFMLNQSNRTRFRSDLVYALGRPDIEKRQLFFCIHPTMNRDMAIRVISDLGVEDPQVIEKPDDALVRQYLDDYPFMWYVRRAVGLFDVVSQDIHACLEKVGAETEVTNISRGAEIERLDSEAESLRNAKALIMGVNPFERGEEVADYCQQFENSLFSWRNRKTGVTGYDQIRKAAYDYDQDLRGFARTLETFVSTAMQSEQQRIEFELSSIYAAVVPIPGFTIGVERPSHQRSVALPDMVETFASQTGTETVSPKNDFFGLFGLAGSPEGETEIVEVASYDVWRFTAKGMLRPVVQRYAEAYERDLREYHSALVEAYAHQLDLLIEQSLEKKERAMAMLSDVERLFEEDKSWLAEFDEQLHAIERN